MWYVIYSVCKYYLHTLRQCANISGSWLAMSSKVMVSKTPCPSAHLLRKKFNGCHLQVKKKPISKLPRSQKENKFFISGFLSIQSSSFHFNISSQFAKKTSDALRPLPPPSLRTTGYSVFWTERRLQWGMKWNKSAGKQQRKLVYF